jgi:hypothetical protein
MSIPLRRPPPEPAASDQARGTQDAIEMANTRDRAERIAHEDEGRRLLAIGAADDHSTSTIEEARQIRAVNARARTHTRRGLTRFVTHTGIGAALAFAAFPVVGPAWTAVLGLGAFTGIRIWERSAR